MKITYYLEVISSWCWWAEPAWADVKRQLDGVARFEWKIALMPPEAYPASRDQCDWFYRRSGVLTGATQMLNSGWFDAAISQYIAPNAVAEACKDLGFDDDRVRLALARAALIDGRRVGTWEISAEIAASVAGHPASDILALARTPEVAQRMDATTREFHTLQVNQRPTFLLENDIGDRAVFSGLAVSEPLLVTARAMLSDERGYASYRAHHGAPPPK